jgi:hypothetical protein
MSAIQPKILTWAPDLPPLRSQQDSGREPHRIRGGAGCPEGYCCRNFRRPAISSGPAAGQKALAQPGRGPFLMSSYKGVLLVLTPFQVFIQFSPVFQVIADHLIYVGQFQAGELLHDLFRGSPAVEGACDEIQRHAGGAESSITAAILQFSLPERSSGKDGSAARQIPIIPARRAHWLRGGLFTPVRHFRGRRVLVSRDFKTMPGHFYHFLESRNAHGIIVIRQA